MRVLVLAATLVALSATLARADALAPPPTDCPEGSIGVTSRWGTHCEHAPCDGTCTPGLMQGPVVCSGDDVAVCVETVAYTPRDVQQGPRMVSLPAETWHVVHGPCDASGACARGTCVRRRACVPEGSAHASGACHVASGARRASPASFFVTCLVGLACLARVRRRSRHAA